MNKPELIKICGLSTNDAIDSVINGGGTHLGFIFFEKSPRHISLEEAKSLSAHVADRLPKVAVTVNADDHYLDQIVEALGPDILQFHGSESIERINQVKSKFGLPVFKALAVKEANDLERAKEYIGTVDHFLFDAKAPEGAELPGGNGVAFDWEVMDHWPQDVPYILSGGLNCVNIEEALNKLSTDGVDVSSGVENAPGKKDNKLIAEFLKIVA